jgi:hypothetical protein
VDGCVFESRASDDDNDIDEHDDREIETRERREIERLERD